MKKSFILFIGLLLWGLQIFAQSTTTTATYSSGLISSLNIGTNVTTANVSPCPGVLTVAVPAGRYVTSINVEYEIEAVAATTAWKSEQRSYLECVTTSTKESAITTGPPINASGTQSYSRTGLTIANGIVPSGGLQFKLHVFQTFGASACSNNYQRVTNNTFKITVTSIPAPSCLPPTAVTVNSVSTNSATLAWTTGGASNWQIEYGPIGFTPGSGTIVNAPTNPYTLTGLNASTSYDFRVRDSCGSSSVSFWSGVVDFKTNCAIINAPWVEHFTSTDWVSGGFNSYGGIDTCYSRNYTNFYTMVTGPPTFTLNLTGPSGDHTTGSGKYIFTQRVNFGTFPSEAWITSPAINLAPLTTPELSFWYHMYGADIGTLTVEISTNGGISFSPIFTKTGQQQTSKSQPWKEQVLSLAAYANDTIVLRFKSNQTTNGTNNNLALDDIDIHEQPSCPKPSNLNVIAATTTSVTLGWTSGGASHWQIEYGSPGFTPGSGTIVNLSTNPATITSLTASSSYEFYVRDSCGATDKSAWSVPVVGRTACSVVAAPYTQNFDNSSWNRGPNFNSKGTIDTCWTRTPLSTYFFKSGPPQFSGVSGAAVDHTTGSASGKYVYAERNLFSGSTDTAHLISPLIDLSALTVPELSFWYHMFGIDIGLLKVEVSNNGGASYSQIFSKNGQQQNSRTDAWKEGIASLAAYANDTILIKFTTVFLNNGISADVCIDDFDIHEAPSCPKPQDLALDHIWYDEATLSWTSGGSAQWELLYGPPGFNPSTTGTKVPSSSNPGTIKGLSPITSYDVYVRDSCGVGDVSVWVGPLRIKTLCTPDTTPYLRTFTGPAFSAGTFFNDTGSVQQCWRRNRVDTYLWKGGPPPFRFTTTGPDKDHTTGLASGKYIYTASIGFSATTPQVTEINSSIINLSGLTTPEFSFWYHMFGADIGKLQLYVGTRSGNWTLLWTKTGQQQTSNADAWKEAIINLSAYSGDTIQLKFKATRNTTGNQAEISLDDFDIHELPTCPKPQNFTLVGMTSNSAVLQWTTGGASNWNIEYGAPGFTPGSGTKIHASTNPFTVTGLSPNTSYQFYVRDSCGATDVSFWVGPVGGKTDCTPVAAPINQTFDGAAWTVGTFSAPGNINSCWKRPSGLNYEFSPETSNTTFSSGPSADHTSGSGKFLSTLRFFGTVTQVDNTWLESPLIDLSPLTVPELSFWYHMFGADIDSLKVEIFDGTSWARAAVLQGQQQVSKTDSWKEMIVNISSYANDTIKVKFTGYRNSTFAFNSVISIDDFNIHEQPTCPKPSALTVNSTTANSVTLGWTSGGASNWQIEYGVPGFSPGTGTIVSANSNPFTVTGLNSSTTYDFYVRDSCSATDQSAWFGPITKATDCLPVVAPFSENFDGSTWVVGPNFNDTGSVAQCWIRPSLVDYFWAPGPPTFTSTLTGPAADHTSGSGKFIYAESAFGGGSPPFDALIETPGIDLSSLTTPQLSFWYHMFGADIGSLKVEIDTGGGYFVVWTKTGQQQASNNDAWKEAIVSLAAYANDTVQVRFKATKNSFFTSADVAIDDILIDEAPSCPKTQDLQLVGMTNSTATLQWTSGGASNWNIEYGSPGFAHGSGTIVNANSNPFTVTGLSANTAYEFYVRDSCAIGDVSDWNGPVHDTTDCNPIAAPYTQNFDGASWTVGTFFVMGNIDACWSRPFGLNYAFSPEITNTSFGTGPSVDHTSGSGKFLSSQRFFGTVQATRQALIESPLIDLSPLTTPELSFWYHMFGTDIDTLSVEVYDGSSWSSVALLTGAQQVSKTDLWKEMIVDISSYANDTIKIRFRGLRSTTTAFSSIIGIDDFDIHEQPSCPQPSGLAITASGAHSVTMGWTSGGATHWQIEYGPAGFSPGSGTIVVANANPFTVTGLNSSTTYDFYVRDSCGATDVSNWFGPATGATDCLPVLAPFSENFEGSVWFAGNNFNDTGSVAQCWHRNPLVDYFWKPGPPIFPSTFTGPSGDHTSGSGKYIYAESIFGGGSSPFNAFIETPSIDLSSLSAPELRFWYHMFGSNIGTMSVEIDAGSGYTSVWSKNGAQQTSGTSVWKQAVINLSSYANDTIRIRFKATKSTFSTLAQAAVDDITVDENPNACPDPSTLSFSSITYQGASANWVTTGSSSQLEIVPLGQPQGSGTLYTGVSHPFNITGLSAGSTYIIYVRDSCNVNVFSQWIHDTLITPACPSVTAGFSFSDNFLNVNFNSGSTLNADSVYWDFGDGNNVSGPNPSHSYVAPGQYIVTLAGFNDCGSQDSYTDTVIVCDTLTADFTYTTIGDTVLFDASSSGNATSYRWSFSGLSDTTGLQVKVKFPTSGTKSVTLTAYNTCGDSIKVTKNVTICVAPVASWTYVLMGTTSAGMKVQFDASASQNAISYDWDFGDGSTGTGVQPLHTYLTPGLFYLVKLKVTNTCGNVSNRAFRLSEIGLPEFDVEAGISLYPNPADQQVQLEWDVQEVKVNQIELMEVSGKIVLEHPINEVKSGNTELDISALAPGYYVVRIYTNKGLGQKKLIIY